MSTRAYTTRFQTMRFPVDRKGVAEILREHGVSDPDSVVLPTPQYTAGGERWSAEQVQAILQRVTGHRVALSEGAMTLR